MAYISGTLGTLMGADLLNLDWLPVIGAPVASIGGAGTFDGVFVTGDFRGAASASRPRQRA